MLLQKQAKILDPNILGGKESISIYWFIKMIIHETKQEPNKKGSNSTILSKKHPDENNRQTNGQNTQHEYKYQQNRLGTVINELLGGLKSILQSSNPRPCLLIFITEIIVRFNQKLPYVV